MKKALIWKSGKLCFKYVEKVLDSVLELKNKNEKMFIQCLKQSRFDKLKELKSEFSLVLGEEGGLYLLLNSVEADSEEESIIKEAGVTEEFLEEKRIASTKKIILGQGAFGKVRLALSIFGNTMVDISQLVCVKKSLRIGEKKNTKLKTNTLANITDSCFEDFFVFVLDLM